MLNRNTLVLALLLAVAFAGVHGAKSRRMSTAVPDSCTRQTGFYDTRTSCNSTVTCELTYCSCVGLARSSTNATTTLCHRPMGISVPTKPCGTVTTCIRSFIGCLNNRSQEIAAAGNTSAVPAQCKLSDVYIEQLALAGGISYRGSPLATKCQRTSCRLAHEYANSTGAAAVCALTTGNASSVCVSPITTEATVTVGGNNWGDVLAHPVFGARVQPSCANDFSGRLNETVTVPSARAGSLIFDAVIGESPTPALLAAMTAAAGDSSWLTSLKSLYAAAGYDPNEVVVLGITSNSIPTAAPTTTSAPEFEQLRRVDDGETITCGAGCIIGIVVTSAFGLAMIVIVFVVCIRVHKHFDVPGEMGIKAPPTLWTKKCRMLNIDPVVAANILNDAVGTFQGLREEVEGFSGSDSDDDDDQMRDENAVKLPKEHRELDCYDITLHISRCVMRHYRDKTAADPASGSATPSAAENLIDKLKANEPIDAPAADDEAKRKLERKRQRRIARQMIKDDTLLQDAALGAAAPLAAFYLRREEERQTRPAMEEVNQLKKIKQSMMLAMTTVVNVFTGVPDDEHTREYYAAAFARSLRQIFGISAQALVAAVRGAGPLVPEEDVKLAVVDVDDANATGGNAFSQSVKKFTCRDDLKTVLSTEEHDAILALIYGLIQTDSGCRKERSMFLGFTYDEVQALRRRLEEEAAIVSDEEGGYVVTRKRFVAAFTHIRGMPPTSALVEKLFPESRTTYDPVDIVNNAATTPADAGDRSFAFHYAARRLQAAFKMELAMKFVPFLILSVVYFSATYGLMEGFYIGKANADYVTLEKFPVLPENFPSDCTPNCAFWDSLYQDMLVDIALREDFVNWVQGPMLDRFWPQSSRTASYPIDGINLPIGALKIRQVRGPQREQQGRYDRYIPDPVTSSEYQLPEQRTLVPQWFSQSFDGIALDRGTIGFSNRNTNEHGYGNTTGADPRVQDAFKYRTREELNASHATYRTAEAHYHPGGHALVIPFNVTGADAAALLQSALDNKWLDLNTRFVIVEAFIYNRQLQAINRVRFANDFTTGGIIVPSFDVYSFSLFHRDLYPNIYFAFVALYLIVGATQVWTAFYVFFWRIPARVTRSEGRRGFKAHLKAMGIHSALNPGAILSLLNALCFLTTWGFRSYWFYFDADRLGEQVMQVEHYPMQLDEVCFLMQTLGYIHAIHVFVLTLMTLDFLAENERLAVVTNTIKLASTQLISLALIFIIALLAISLAGHIAYGHHIMEYSTIYRSVGNTLLAVLGNIDYEAWKQVHVHFTPFYFAVLQVVLILLLLNMVITVLMDAFEEVISNTFDPADLSTIMENDHDTAIARPTFVEAFRHHPIYGIMRKTLLLAFLRVKLLVFKLQSCCGSACCVSEDFDYRRAVAMLSRSDQYRFWKGTQRSVEFIQFGNVFESAIGHMHFAELSIPLASGEYDQLMTFDEDDEAKAKAAKKETDDASASEKMVDTDDDSGSSDDGSDSDSDEAHLERRSVRTLLLEEYGEDTLPVILSMFQELPNYHLGVPSHELLLSLAEVRHYWRQAIDDYTFGDDDDDSLTPHAANVLVQKRKDTMLEVAVARACRNAKLLFLPRKHFDFGGFYPIISPIQAESIRMQFDEKVRENATGQIEAFMPVRVQDKSKADLLRAAAATVGGHSSPLQRAGSTVAAFIAGDGAATADEEGDFATVPYGVTIGSLADIFKRANVGKPSRFVVVDNAEEDYTVWMQPMEFRTMSQRVHLPNGHAYEFVSALSLESLIERGLEEYHRRKNHRLAFGWETRAVSVFVRAAAGYTADEDYAAFANELKRRNQDIIKRAKSYGEKSERCQSLLQTVADIPPLERFKERHEFSLERQIIEHHELSRSFLVGYAAAVGRPWSPKENENYFAALEGVPFRDFLNYATKLPGEHSQHGFFAHFAARMTEQSGQAFRLLWYIIFVVLFTVFLVTGRGLGETANMHISLMELMETQQYKFPQVNKSDDQFIYVANVDDWKGFMGEIILPTLYGTGVSVGAGTGQGPLPELPTTAIGAVRIRQVRSDDYDCGDQIDDLLGRDGNENATTRAWYDDRIGKYFSTTCAKSWSGSLIGNTAEFFGFGNNDTFQNDESVPARVRNAWRHRSCGELGTSGTTTNDYYSFPCNGYALVLPLNLTEAEATADFNYILNNGWLDDNTAMLMVEVTYFHFGVNAFARWKFQLYIDTSGGFEPFSQVANFVPWITAEQSTAFVVFLVIYLINLFVQFCLFIWTMVTAYRANRARRMRPLRAFFSVFVYDVWIPLNLVTFGIFFAVWVMRFTMMARSVDGMEIWDANRVVDEVDSQAAIYKNIDVLDAVTALVTYSRLVSFFNLIPSLGLLGRTVKIALPNMASLLFVFITTFWCFVCIGHTIYGSVFWDFTSVSRTFASLSRVLLGDGIDYDEISALHPVYAGVYYALFMIFCSFVFFNLIVAVLNSAFEQARAEMYNFKPLYETIEHDAFAQQTLKGVRGSFLFDLLVNELQLAFWTTVYVIYYPFGTNVALDRIHRRFFRNPRYFWWMATRCFEAENPAHAWFRFIDDIFGRRDLLGVTSNVEAASDRVESNCQGSPQRRMNAALGAASPADTTASAGAHASPDRQRHHANAHTGGGRASGNTLGLNQTNDDEPNASFADRLALQFSSTMSRIFGAAANNDPTPGESGQPSPRQRHLGGGATPPPDASRSPGAAGSRNPFGNDNDSLVGDDDASDVLDADGEGGRPRIGMAMARTDIRQSFFDADPDQWRVQRVWELFANHMADHATSAWAMVRISSELTQIHRRQIVEWAMQEMNTYWLQSAAYDGNTVSRLEDTVRRIEKISEAVGQLDSVAAHPTLTDELLNIMAVGNGTASLTDNMCASMSFRPQPNDDVPVHWKMLVRQGREAVAASPKHGGAKRRQSDMLDVIQGKLRGDDDAEGGAGVAAEAPDAETKDIDTDGDDKSDDVGAAHEPSEQPQQAPVETTTAPAATDATASPADDAAQPSSDAAIPHSDAKPAADENTKVANDDVPAAAAAKEAKEPAADGSEAENATEPVEDAEAVNKRTDNDAAEAAKSGDDAAEK